MHKKPGQLPPTTQRPTRLQTMHKARMTAEQEATKDEATTESPGANSRKTTEHRASRTIRTTTADRTTNHNND